ncbi:unnamed protein product [Rhodiola kirilowii]
MADNPGVWFMHCHLERHVTWGMDTVRVHSPERRNIRRAFCHLRGTCLRA